MPARALHGRKKEMFLIPTREEVRAAAREYGLTDGHADALYNVMSENKWKRKDGKFADNWKDYLLAEIPQGHREFLTGDLNKKVIERQRERHRDFMKRYNDPNNHDPSIEYVRQKSREAEEADNRKA